MKLQEVKCPNCQGSDVEVVGEGMMKCRYCRTTFTIDYDAEDAAMDKNRTDLQMQREQFEHQDKVRKEVKKSQLRGVCIYLGVLFAIVGTFAFLVIRGQNEDYDTSSTETVEEEKNVYVSELSEIPEDQLEDMKTLVVAEAKEDAQDTAISGITADEPEFVETYLLEKKEGEGNRLVFIYKETWHRNGESTETYVAFWLDDLELLSDGSVKYSTIVQSDMELYMWGHYFVDGTESLDLCYTKAISSKADYKVID